MHLFWIKIADKIQDLPNKHIDISQLIALTDQDRDLNWGVDPSGEFAAKNSDGSIVKMKPRTVFFMNIPEKTFIMCYEYGGGLAIHCPRHERCVNKCLHLAEILGAKLFKLR